METFSALLAPCAGNSPVSGEFPAQRLVTRSFDVFFDLAKLNGWANTREAGDLRRYRAHYDIIVMFRYCTHAYSTQENSCRTHAPYRVHNSGDTVYLVQNNDKNETPISSVIFR